MSHYTAARYMSSKRQWKYRKARAKSTKRKGPNKGRPQGGTVADCDVLR